ncbi:MAG: sigma-E factor regulatory protein RseB domain-containing protein, partial [Pseudomonadota bacterium]|nr:sigma-E factor regulatory protein RseB domain-containing protein [Pseudomonadota bacterium]
MKPGVSGRTDGAPARLAVSVPVPPEITRLAFFFALLFASCAEAATPDPLVLEQLERMATAVRTLSYEGTVVYLHENRLETLRVIHRIENGQVQEKLVSLNGPVRTVTRGQDQVTCELSDSHSISIQRQGVAGEVMRSRAIDPEVLSANYLIRPLGATRVAGRKTNVVGIIPRDDLRYGYRFYLDLESGLPLKTDLMGQAAEPVEQIMFTSLDILPLDDEATAPVAAAVGDIQGVPPGEDLAVVPPSCWRFAELPPGFSLVM